MRNIIPLIISFFITPISVFQCLHCQEDVLRPFANSQSYSRKSTAPTEQYSLGIEGGLALNMFSQSMQWTPEIPESPFKVRESGFGISPNIGINFKYQIEKRILVFLKLSYNWIYFRNSFQGYADCLIDYVRLDLPINSSYSVDGNYIGLTAGLEYYLNRSFFISFGPSFQIMQHEFTEELKFEIDQPENYPDCSLTNGLDDITINDNINVNSIIGIELGLGYRYFINKNISINPNVRYVYTFSKFREGVTYTDITRFKRYDVSVVNEDNSKLNFLQFVIVFLYHF